MNIWVEHTKSIFACILSMSTVSFSDADRQYLCELYSRLRYLTGENFQDYYRLFISLICIVKRNYLSVGLEITAEQVVHLFTNQAFFLQTLFQRPEIVPEASQV